MVKLMKTMFYLHKYGASVCLYASSGAFVSFRFIHEQYSVCDLSFSIFISKNNSKRRHQKASFCIGFLLLEPHTLVYTLHTHNLQAFAATKINSNERTISLSVARHFVTYFICSIWACVCLCMLFWGGIFFSLTFVRFFFA